MFSYICIYRAVITPKYDITPPPNEIFTSWWGPGHCCLT